MADEQELVLKYSNLYNIFTLEYNSNLSFEFYNLYLSCKKLNIKRYQDRFFMILFLHDLDNFIKLLLLEDLKIQDIETIYNRFFINSVKQKFNQRLFINSCGNNNWDSIKFKEDYFNWFLEKHCFRINF